MEKINYEPMYESTQSLESWESIEQSEQERKNGIIHKLGKTAIDIVRRITKKSEIEVAYETPVPKLARLDSAWWYKNVYLPEQDSKAKKQQSDDAIDMHDDVRVDENKNRDNVIDNVEKENTNDGYSEDELLADMITAREYFDRRESERNRNRHNERAQELFERELNGKLSTAEQFIDAVKARESGIRGYSLSYDGATIPVITLEGFPYAMLTHTVDYRGKDKEGNNESGRKTAQAVLDNPSIWAESLDKAREQSDYGVAGRDKTRGNVLSASYTNSEHNMQTSFLKTGKDLTYGFNRVDPDSVIRVTNGDGNTPNMIGENPTEMHRTGYLEELEETPDLAYNEVTLRRYNANGKPKLPDYIVTKDGEISEAALKHAKFFKIPIVDIRMDRYREKQAVRAREILGSIDFAKPYPILREKIDKLYGLDSIGTKSNRKQQIGSWVNLTSGTEEHDSELGEDIAQAEVIDSMRGLKYVEEQLREQIQKLRDAFNNGSPVKAIPEEFDIFEVSMIDVRRFKEKSYTSRLDYGANINAIGRNLGPEAMDQIHLVFKLKDSPRITDITVCDGEHPIGGAEYAHQEADSRYYEELAPVVSEYLDLLMQNNT